MSFGSEVIASGAIAISSWHAIHRDRELRFLRVRPQNDKFGFTVYRRVG
ncbi:MAG: hypothetical protein ABIU09_03435 [Pyrinomonadaceae bacterium]